MGEVSLYSIDVLVRRPSSSSLLLSSLELSDTKVYEPEIRARLGTAANFLFFPFSLSIGRRLYSHALSSSLLSLQVLEGP